MAFRIVAAVCILMLAAVPAYAHGHDSGGGNHPDSGSHPDSGGQHDDGGGYHQDYHPDPSHHQDSGGHPTGGLHEPDHHQSALHEPDHTPDSHLSTPNHDLHPSVVEHAHVAADVTHDLSSGSHLPGVCADDPELLVSLGLPITEQLRLACQWPEEWRR